MQALMYTWTWDKNQWPCKRRSQRVLQNWRVSYRGRGWLLPHCQDKNTDSDSSGEYSLAWTLLEVAISHQEKRALPNISSAGTPQARQPTGQEHGCTYQQTDCLRSSWTHGCLLNINSVAVLPDKGTTFRSTHQWAATSPNYQEACRSLRDSLINQLGDSRSKNYNLAAFTTKVKITESQTKFQQRNMSQMMEQDKTSEEHLSEVEIGNQFETEFRVIIVMMIQGLWKKNSTDQ